MIVIVTHAVCIRRGKASFWAFHFIREEKIVDWVSFGIDQKIGVVVFGNRIHGTMWVLTKFYVALDS